MNALAPSNPSTSWTRQFGLTPPAFENEAQAQEYAAWLLSFQKRPWDWVLACYPWGIENSPLEFKHPELWQRDWLKRFQKELERTDIPREKAFNRVIRLATAAGHGVGKSTLVAWMIHWFVSVFPGGHAVITASTDTQLHTKTWRALAEWHPLTINGWQLEWTATRYKHKDAPETWYASAIPWSDSNPQAFAGEHGQYVLIIFDEASAISPAIWEVIKGAFTTGLVFFLAFGNPTEGEGGFYDAFHKPGEVELWIHFRVDAREVSFSNKDEIAAWIVTYGADSDFCRTRIYGQFPKQASATFIGSEVVVQAQLNIIEWKNIPRIVPRLMGVDLARQGDDLNAIVKRQGRKVHPQVRTWAERDSMISADYIAREINEWQPDLVFVDGTGMGGPVIDYLKRRNFGRIIVECQYGARPNSIEDAKRYANMRTTMWARLREALPYMDLPAIQQLAEELCGPKFRFELKTDRLLLEPKEEMRKRGLKSPNMADALAQTFWFEQPMAVAAGSGMAEPDAT